MLSSKGIEKEFMVRAFRCEYIFQPIKYSPEVHHCVCRSFDKANENSSPELKNKWIVGLTGLSGKSIKDRMKGGNISYNDHTTIEFM
jgi:hypothetical protein